MVRIIESIRDGLQGLNKLVSIEKKVAYTNAILKAGFDAVDIGSFVSPQAVPQMADTGDLIQKIDLNNTSSKIMTLVANKKGAEIGAEYDQLDYLIYPFTISETFLKKNINADFEKSERTIDEILNICIKKNKEFTLYISMAFGNPYGDEWSVDLILEWIEKFAKKNIKEISISDTTGLSTEKSIKEIFENAVLKYPDILFGLHLHTPPNDWYNRIDSAWNAGCKWFDTVMGGLGGCPMTGYELLSNLNTYDLAYYFSHNKIEHKLNMKQLDVINQIKQELID